MSDSFFSPMNFQLPDDFAEELRSRYPNTDSILAAAEGALRKGRVDIVIGPGPLEGTTLRVTVIDVIESFRKILQSIFPEFDDRLRRAAGRILHAEADPRTCPHGEIPAGASGCVDCLVVVAEAARAHLAAWDAFVNVRPGDYMQAGARSDTCNRTEKTLRAALAALDGKAV